MKKIVLALFIFLVGGLLSYAQEIKKDSLNGILPLKDGKVYYEEVVKQDGTATDLYVRAKTAFADIFKSSKDVIQMDDKDSGIIIGKGIFQFKSEDIYFTIKIQTRDGRYKIDMYDMYTEGSIKMARDIPSVDYHYELHEWHYITKHKKRQIQFNDKIQSIFTSIKEAIKNNSYSGSNENW